jgi:hypothetical protein
MLHARRVRTVVAVVGRARRSTGPNRRITDSIVPWHSSPCTKTESPGKRDSVHRLIQTGRHPENRSSTRRVGLAGDDRGYLPCGSPAQVVGAGQGVNGKSTSRRRRQVSLDHVVPGLDRYNFHQPAHGIPGGLDADEFVPEDRHLAGPL